MRPQSYSALRTENNTGNNTAFAKPLFKLECAEKKVELKNIHKIILSLLFLKQTYPNVPSQTWVTTKADLQK